MRFLRHPGGFLLQLLKRLMAFGTCQMAIGADRRPCGEDTLPGTGHGDPPGDVGLTQRGIGPALRLALRPRGAAFDTISADRHARVTVVRVMHDRRSDHIAVARR